MSHCLENQENYDLTLKQIQEQHVSPEKQRDATQRFLIAQGRGCSWPTKDDRCPTHFVNENESSRDVPMYGYGCCGIGKLDTSMDSQKGSYQYWLVCGLDRLRLKDVSLEEHLEQLKDGSMVIDLQINDNNDRKKNCTLESLQHLATDEGCQELLLSAPGICGKGKQCTQHDRRPCNVLCEDMQNL